MASTIAERHSTDKRPFDLSEALVSAVQHRPEARRGPGGTVAAANRPEGGAVLSFTLPLTTAPLVAGSALAG